MGSRPLPTETFEVTGSTHAYRGFISVWRKSVAFPNGRTFDWDVAGHNRAQPCFVCIFPFFTSTKTTRLVAEYAQGTNGMLYTFPCGGITKEHTSSLHAVECELSEEAHLKGGRVIPLLPEGHKGISELKWGTNHFLPYLVLDPLVDDSPMERDDEEYMHVVPDVSMDALDDIIARGDMMLPSVQTAYMGLRYLRQHALN